MEFGNPNWPNARLFRCVVYSGISNRCRSDRLECLKPLAVTLRAKLAELNFGACVDRSISFRTHKGAFGPEIPIGWPNRFMLGTYVMWLMAVSLALWQEF